MLTMLLDFFCSRPFPEQPSRLTRVVSWVTALFWGVAVFAVGAWLAGDFAVPGENTVALSAFSGSPEVMKCFGVTLVNAESYPILWWLTGLLGETPSMAALNLLGAGILGALVALTWVVVRFWGLDAMGEETLPRQAERRSWVLSSVACVLAVASLPGLYAASGLTVNAWGFMLLLLCVALQNAYVMGGGHRRMMFAFAFVLGVCAVESPWVLFFLPLFFLRALLMEWRLWDQSVRNLPYWFVGVVAGAGVLLALNTWRVTDGFSLLALWGVERAALQGVVLPTIGSWFTGPWILNVAAAGLLPLLAWITARRMLDNGRSWGLLFVGLALTAASFAMLWGVGPTPWRDWLMRGAAPVATHWVFAVTCAMLIVGWGVQLFAKNPNLYEELDRRRMPACVLACRVAAIFLFPLCVVAAGVTIGVHGVRFAGVDRAMATRFAAETVDALAKEGRTYLLGARSGWIDPHLALVAQQKGVPLTVFTPALAERTDAETSKRRSEAQKAMDAIAKKDSYIERLRRHIESDPHLGDVDRLRLTHLLDYHFLVFVQDFFVAQPNAAKLAGIYDLADVWYSAGYRPFPVGTFYVPIPADAAQASDEAVRQAEENQRALEARWAPTLDKPFLMWWDLTRGAQASIRKHLAFMSNNLGAWLDDEGRQPAAALCYLYAAETDAENVSAKLNLYDICLRRGQIQDKLPQVNRIFEEFIKAQTARRANTPRYDLNAVGRIHGYIRNYDLFVQMGWEWAATAAPGAILAGLRNARDSLQSGDPRLGAINAVAGAVYELQGKTDLSYAAYQEVLVTDPDNVDALRGLARISLQRGNVDDAGKWFAQAEAAAAKAGVPAGTLALDRAAYLMARTDLAGAADVVAAYTAENQDSVDGWAMLGMIEVERADRARADGNETQALRHYNDARGFILENIKRLAKGDQLYFLHILQGRLAQADALKAGEGAAAAQDLPKAARELWLSAREQYQRAYTLRPRVHGLLELILGIDRRLGDKAAAEADAFAILRDDPDNPYGNFVVGTQRLEDAHLREACLYFKKAYDLQGDRAGIELINNYADALARVEPDRAETVGLRAITLAPNSYETWATYALTLARNGKPAEAQTALARSLDFAKQYGITPDPRVGNVTAWIALANRDKAAAQAALEDVKAALGDDLTPLDRHDLAALQAAIDAL